VFALAVAALAVVATLLLWRRPVTA